MDDLKQELLKDELKKEVVKKDEFEIKEHIYKNMFKELSKYNLQRVEDVVTGEPKTQEILGLYSRYDKVSDVLEEVIDLADWFSQLVIEQVAKIDVLKRKLGGRA